LEFFDIEKPDEIDERLFRVFQEYFIKIYVNADLATQYG